MQLSGLHLLITYQCTFECDHCFAWGSPWQEGTMTLQDVRHILQQADQRGGVEWIYFEGGEPFLYYPTMVKGVEMAARAGYRVGVVSNAYWGTSLEDAVEWLRPLAAWVQDLSISSDLYHYNEKLSLQVKNANQAAEVLSIPVGVISIAQPDCLAEEPHGQLPLGESAVCYRGRAAVKLAGSALVQPWERYTECPFEDLRDPGRVHIDPLGNIHICQGISIGNIYQTSLTEICSAYDPQEHPITGALLAGGPSELVDFYQLPHAQAYADACHLCYTARSALRSRFPEYLLPDQMYGIYAQ
jgi:hypothetical protein